MAIAEAETRGPGVAPGDVPFVLVGSGSMCRAADSHSELRGYQGVKVFVATVRHARETLGERVTDWLRASPDQEIVAAVVTQSSGGQFHCLTITLFWRGRDTWDDGSR